jgi:cytochrome P450
MAFKPERWMGANQEDILEASQPFSLGPRACLGRKSVHTTSAELAELAMS